MATTAGCATGPSPSDDGGPILVPVQDSYPSALIEGTLEVRQGCFVVGDAVLLLPEGTDWDPDTERLTIAGTVVAVGHRVGLGGGEVPASLVEELAGSGEREAAERCLDNGAGEVLVLVAGA